MSATSSTGSNTTQTSSTVTSTPSTSSSNTGTESTTGTAEATTSLAKTGREELALHRKVHRTWGWYDSIDECERFYPVFQFVVVYAQGKGAFCAPTVEDGLKQMLGQSSPVTSCSVAPGNTSGGTGSGSPTTTTTTVPGTATTVPSSTTVPPATGSSADYINQAAAAYQKAQDALKAGDPVGYATYIQQMGQLVQQAQQAQAQGR